MGTLIYQNLGRFSFLGFIIIQPTVVTEIVTNILDFMTHVTMFLNVESLPYC